jgi:O-succinylhomoserine sulfhydrylase
VVVVAFEIIGGIEAGRNFLDKIKLCSLSKFGDTRTTFSSNYNSKLSVDERLAVSITDGLVRVSVGLETVKDVIADLEQRCHRF